MSYPPKLRSLASLICEVMQNTRGGHYPSVHTTFAAIGVDSLGSIIFVKQLSIRLGGLRIDPLIIFAPGMTIKMFAEVLTAKILKENPSLLLKLAISSSLEGGDSSLARMDVGLAVDEGDIETSKYGDNNFEFQALNSGEKLDNNDVDDYDPNSLESSFSSLIASNRGLIEGMRGLFTVMVLLDHFLILPGQAQPSHVCLYCIHADTSLFVALSGLTTALQLRSSPQWEECVAVDDEAPHETLSINKNRKKTTWVLKPRARFNWSYFLVTRAVGIFPILWIGLLLNIPIWYLPDLYFTGTKGADILEKGSVNGNICVFLYAIGMQVGLQIII